jgi:hypothetical protein
MATFVVLWLQLGEVMILEIAARGAKSNMISLVYRHGRHRALF